MKYAKSKILILSITFTMCMLFAVLMGNFSTAKAQVSLATNLTMQGASIRVEEPTGLRFAYSVDDYDEVSNANTNYGMLIVPYDYLADAGILEIVDGVDYVTVLKNAKQQSLINYDPIVVENIKPILVDGEYIVQHSIASIYETNYNRSWFAIGFIKDGDNYVYSKVTDKNVRDVLYVASTVLNKYYYDVTFKTEKPEMYQQCQNNEILLKAFVTKGIANVTDSLPYAIEGGKSAVWKGVDDTLNLKVTETKYINLNTYWASSNNNVLTVDQNGKVTIVGEGTAKITAKSCELYSAEYSITVYDRQTETQNGEILFVTADGGTKGFKNIAGSGNPTVATDADLGTLTGNYTGNALNITTTSNVILVGVLPRITESDWDKAKENGYTKMYIWVAATTDNENAKVNMQQMPEDNSLKGNGLSLELGVWTKLTYELTDENKALLFNGGFGAITRFYRWNGSATMSAYIGDCGFDESTRIYPVQDGEIAFVNNEVSLSYFNYTVGQNSELATKSLASETDLEKLTGNYTGNAVKITARTDYSRYFITPRITETEWDKAVNDGYTKFYVWVAVENTGDKLGLQLKPENSIAFTSFNVTDCTWYKFAFDLNDTNKAFVFADGGFKLFCAFRFSGTTFAIYIGDCGFNNDSKYVPVKDGEIAFINNETCFDNFIDSKSASSNATKTLATAEELATLDGGDNNYQGNAIKIAQCSEVKLLPRITEEQWDKAVADGYTKIYYYAATDHAYIQLKTGTNFLHETNRTLTQNTWRRFEIEINDALKAKIFADGGVIMYSVTRWSSTSTPYTFYIGDCGFSK